MTNHDPLGYETSPAIYAEHVTISGITLEDAAVQLSAELAGRFALIASLDPFDKKNRIPLQENYSECRALVESIGSILQQTGAPE